MDKKALDLLHSQVSALRQVLIEKGVVTSEEVLKRQKLIEERKAKYDAENDEPMYGLSENPNE